MSFFRKPRGHGNGWLVRGEYKYFRYPLPDVMRNCARVLPASCSGRNRWNAAMGIEIRYPEIARRIHPEVPRRGAGEADAVLLLQYGEGDYTACTRIFMESTSLIQVAILLSEPSRDFTGGDLW